MPETFYETRAVLAAAYKGVTPLAAGLTHTVMVQDNHGPEVGERVLCKRVRVEHLADPYALSEAERAAPPTCPACRAKDPRFH